MSVSDAVASPIPRKGVEYPRILLPDYGLLEDAFKMLRKAEANKVLDECGITAKADRAAALIEVLKKPVSMSDIDGFLGTKTGAALALKRSLKAAKVGEDEIKSILDSFPIEDATALARALVFSGVYSYGEPVAQEDVDAPLAGELAGLLSPMPDAETSDGTTAPTPPL